MKTPEQVAQKIRLLEVMAEDVRKRMMRDSHRLDAYEAQIHVLKEGLTEQQVEMVFPIKTDLEENPLLYAIQKERLQSAQAVREWREI
jgi:hypothetical protein